MNEYTITCIFTSVEHISQLWHGVCLHRQVILLFLTFYWERRDRSLREHQKITRELVREQIAWTAANRNLMWSNVNILNKTYFTAAESSAWTIERVALGKGQFKHCRVRHLKMALGTGICCRHEEKSSLKRSWSRLTDITEDNSAGTPHLMSVVSSFSVSAEDRLGPELHTSLAQVSEATLCMSQSIQVFPDWLFLSQDLDMKWDISYKHHLITVSMIPKAAFRKTNFVTWPTNICRA